MPIFQIMENSTKWRGFLRFLLRKIVHALVSEMYFDDVIVR